MIELLSLNVNDRTEKKNGLTYLSWAWAWAEVLKADPGAEWEAVEYPMPDGTLAPCMYMQNGTAMVKTKVTIKGKTRSCMLPVMDHRNKAIPQPDSFAVNTAIMRCMTKAISMHGLGLYIYAGEDLPQADVPESEDDKIAREARERRGAELDELCLYLIDCHENGKDMDAVRVFYAEETWSKDVGDRGEEQLYVWGQLKPNSKLRSMLKANKPAEADAKRAEETKGA